MIAGRISFSCVDVASGEVLAASDPHSVHYAASTIKLVVMVALARALDGGRLRLDDPVEITDSWTGADGEPFGLVPDDVDPELATAVGERRPLRELAERMVTTSSNVAANTVIDIVGIPAVNAAATALGAAGCRLRHHFGDRRARAAGPHNEVTAAGLAMLVGAVGAGGAASGERCRWIEATCAAQEHRGLIPAALPEGTQVADKPGWAEGVLHDVALVRPAGAGAYGIAVCSSGYTDPEAAAAEVRRVAAACHDGVTTQATR